MASNMDCLFCKIVEKKIAAEIIYEDPDTIAFLDIHPKSPGHTMVVPKTHAENILGLETGKIQPTFLTVKKVTDILSRVFLPTADAPKGQEPNGFTIGINHGKASGQVVDHLHIHIIPRFDKDGGSSIHSVVDNPSKASVEEIAKIIKNVYRS